MTFGGNPMRGGQWASGGRPGGGDAAPRDPRLLRRVAALFRPHRGRLTLIAVAIVVSSGLGVVTPFLTQRLFDDALFVSGGPRLGLLTFLVALMIVIPLLSALIGVGQTYLTTVLGNRVMAALRGRLFEHLQAMDLGFFTATKTGAIQSRLANDVGGVQSVLTETASSILANVVTVTASLVAMLLLSWQLTIVALALLPLFVVLQVRVGRVRQRLAARTQSSLSDMTAITQETLSVSGILLAKVFNRQATETARYRAENERQVDLQVRQTMTGQSFFAVVQTFFGITPAIVYLVAGLAITRGTVITAGTIVAFTTLQTRLLFPVINLLRVALDVQTSLALFARIFEYLDLKPAITDRPGAVTLDRDAVRGEVRMEHVWFRYPGQGDPRPDADGAAPPAVPAQARPEGAQPPAEEMAVATWALRDVSLVVEPGQLAAVVGPSGAGKTTLSYLVPRLYDVQEGAVRLDGHDVRDLTLESLADGCPGGQHPRPDHELRRRVRHRRRRAWLPAVGRGEAAARPRPGDPQGPARAHPRRGHVGARHDERAARPGGARDRDARAHDHRDRAPALDDPRRRRDPRGRRRPDRRAGHARRAARARRPLRAALHRAVRGRPRAGPLRGRRRLQRRPRPPSHRHLTAPHTHRGLDAGKVRRRR